MSEALGFDSRVPTTLLLIEATEKQIGVLMLKPLRMVGFLLTGGTFTLV